MADYNEIEQRIIDMWPKFEDGTYVWFGDAYSDAGRDDEEVVAVEFRKRHASLVGLEGFYTKISPGERVKRPEPEDSWERLEKDAEKGNCEYLGRSQSSCDGCYLNGKSACDEYVRIDLIRRAKALAEKEAAR